MDAPVSSPLVSMRYFGSGPEAVRSNSNCTERINDLLVVMRYSLSVWLVVGGLRVCKWLQIGFELTGYSPDLVLRQRR
jgi:hypothetical protein